MDKQQLIAEVYRHLESDRLDHAVMASLRLARLSKDAVNAVAFLFEMYLDARQRQQFFADETSNLSDEARKFVWKKALEDWLDAHRLDLASGADPAKANVLALGVGELCAEVPQIQRMISELSVPAGMGAYDTAAFTDRFAHQKLEFWGRLQGINRVKERISARCVSYVSRVEKEAKLQAAGSAFLSDLQNEVNKKNKAPRAGAVQFAIESQPSGDIRWRRGIALRSGRVRGQGRQLHGPTTCDTLGTVVPMYICIQEDI